MSKKFSVLIKNKIKKYNKKITVDPDKSITHRCYILASQCTGISKINGLQSEDIEATINGLKKLGIKIENDENDYDGGLYDGLVDGIKDIEKLNDMIINMISVEQLSKGEN